MSDPTSEGRFWVIIHVFACRARHPCDIDRHDDRLVTTGRFHDLIHFSKTPPLAAHGKLSPENRRPKNPKLYLTAFSKSTRIEMNSVRPNRLNHEDTKVTRRKPMRRCIQIDFRLLFLPLFFQRNKRHRSLYGKRTRAAGAAFRDEQQSTRGDHIDRTTRPGY